MAEPKKAVSVIDPIYKKYTQSVIRALSSTEFYEFFMDAISKARNEFQFSNRKMIKTVDEKWVEAIEDCLPGLQNIIASPRNVIKEEELIVNVAHAKKGGSDVVRHLAQHGALVERFDEDTGEVRPSRLMQKYREDSTDLYENRLTFTVLESAYHFVRIRHDALFSAMGDEFGAKLKLQSDMESASETMHMDLFLHIREKDDPMQTDIKNKDIFERISRLYRLLSVFMNTAFAQQLAKLNRVKGTIVKTNVLKKNPNYKAIVRLYEFLQHYSDVGYTIRVVEQSPEINELFERDIFHNIMFNYIVLKGYLEDENSRRIPTPPKEKQKTLKPKYIHQIIEELTEDYDLPDVEIRKVLIEELTKEQLMREEAEERRRLVEEREKRIKEEKERQRAEKKAEQERIRQEKEAERERIRQEKEAQKQRQLQEQLERENEERRRGRTFRQELDAFAAALNARLENRVTAAEKEAAQREKVKNEDAAKLLSEAEIRQREEAERIRKKEKEEEARIRREKELEEQRKKEEYLRKKEEARQQEEQRLKENAKQLLSPQITELQAFSKALQDRLQERVSTVVAEQQQRETAAEEKKIRRKGLFSLWGSHERKGNE